MKFRAPKGTDDILPPASRRWRRLLRVWDGITERYGYELIMTPIFEATEVFERTVGEATEVVQKQMFTWEDKAGRSMTLRPEATASVVRAYLQAGSPGIMKVAYAGPMFRYEQPQAGRRRQFFQVGVEYVGEDAPGADVEVIEIGHRYYREIGITDVEVGINSIGDPESRAAYRRILLEYLEQRRQELCDDCRSRMDLNPLRVLDCKVDAPKLADAPVPVDWLNKASGDHYQAVKQGLDEAGIKYREEPRLVRGLDYYTRTVFEYTSPSYEAAQAELGGGGRYDGLAEALGGVPTPAVGFSLGMDRIVLALEGTEEIPALDVFVVLADPARRGQAEELTARLRSDGLRTDRLAREATVRAQFKAAHRRGAAAVAVVGEEMERGRVTMRSMADGSESEIAIEEVGEWLKSR